MNVNETMLAQLMTREVIKVRENDPLAVVRNLLRERRFHHVLVVEGDRPIGVISDRDVLRTLSPFLDTVVEQPRDVNTLGIKARQIMSRRVVTARPTDTVAQAVRLLLENEISCLPVTDEEGKLLGIVTNKDILRFVAEANGE